MGSITQNMHLQGTVLGIGMVLVGSFNNEKVKTKLNLPDDLEPCALACMGNVE